MEQPQPDQAECRHLLPRIVGVEPEFRMSGLETGESFKVALMHDM
jgi:hypothetical protein